MELICAPLIKDTRLRRSSKWEDQSTSQSGTRETIPPSADLASKGARWDSRSICNESHADDKQKAQEHCWTHSFNRRIHRRLDKVWNQEVWKSKRGYYQGWNRATFILLPEYQPKKHWNSYAKGVFLWWKTSIRLSRWSSQKKEIGQLSDWT